MRTRIASLALSLVAVLAVGLVAAESKSGSEKGPRVGEAAPGFTLADIHGDKHSLSDFRGQVVVIHFQSCTCPWEAEYQPIFNEMAEKYRAEDEDEQDPVQFLAINANHNESRKQLRKYAKNKPVVYPILKDEGNEVADKYQAQTTPHIYVVDEKGVLRYKGGVEKAPLAPKHVGDSDSQYLGPVLEAITAGEDLPHKDTRAIGCSIKRTK